LTFQILASLVLGTILVGNTFTPSALSVWVADVSGWADAAGPLSAVDAIGVDAARIVSGARIGPTSGSGVGVAGKSAQAPTNRSLATGRAIGVATAGSVRARVKPATYVSIAGVSRWALANGSVALGLANGIYAARVVGAWVLNAVGVGVSVVASGALADGGAASRRALGVGAARSLAARVQLATPECVVGVAGVALLAGAHRAVVAGFAVRVGSARVFEARHTIAPNKWISTVPIPAVADGSCSVLLAVGIDPARRGQAGVEHAVGEGIALVVGLAGADSLSAAVLAVGVGTAGVLGTRVVVAPDERIAEESPGTLADGRPASLLAVGVLAAGSLFARVGHALAVGVALVVLRATADGPAASHRTDGVGSARVASARIAFALGPQGVERSGVGDHGVCWGSSARRPPEWTRRPRPQVLLSHGTFAPASHGAPVNCIATRRSVVSWLTSADGNTLLVDLTVCIWTTWCGITLAVDSCKQADGRGCQDGYG